MAIYIGLVISVNRPWDVYWWVISVNRPWDVGPPVEEVLKALMATRQGTTEMPPPSELLESPTVGRLSSIYLNFFWGGGLVSY